MLKRKEKKQKVYICTACYLEDSPYGNGKFQGIFLTDIYLKEKNGKLVNFFNENEEYAVDGVRLGHNDVELIVNSEKLMTPDEVFWDMFYNVNYCKDRLGVMDKYLGEDCSKLQSIDFHRYREIMNLDPKIESRYDKFAGNKVLVIKR